MKKLLIVFIAAIVYILLFTGTLSAQQNFNIGSELAYEKASTPNATPAPVSNNVATPTTEESRRTMKANYKAEKARLKASSYFQKNFQAATNVTWTVQPDYLVTRFNLGDQKAGKTVYSRTGSFLYTILTFSADQMPVHVRTQIKKAYPQCDITMAQEIHSEGKIIFNVYLEDCTTIKQILVTDNNMVVREDFVKAR